MILRRTKVIGKNVLLQAVIFLCLLLPFSLVWAKNNFGNIGFEEIVFHLNMPLKGTSNEFVGDYIKKALCPAVLLFLAELAIVYFPSKYKYYFVVNKKEKKQKIQIYPLHFPIALLLLFFLVWIGGLVYSADKSFGFVGFVKNQAAQSNFIKEEYVSPADVKITFPEKKRNLICIYVESAESSAQDKENGGVFDTNYIPEMTALAKDNVSFSHSDKIEGAVVAPACGWTVAALVAETSGLPLKLFSYKDKEDDGKKDNSMKRYDSFMPGAVSMGEILDKEGYKNYFMAGSDFGGRTSYFTQHGEYEIWDYYSAIKEGRIPSDYKVWWGFEDVKLYEFAKEKILSLAKKDEPFNFSMLTVDTHHQDGYICKKCPDTYDEQYSNVWACASAQVDEFVKWIQQQDFYENTSIVIVGDHCSMDTNYYDDLKYDKHHGETTRKVYNAFINSSAQPVQEKNRRFTTLDIFPTTLACIGVEIEGNRLGLGTNLFSEEQTLAEKYGYEKMFKELDKKSVFYNKEILYP